MIDITEADFSIDEVVKKARSGDVGAIVTFLGTVRNDDIKSMELEAYKEVAISELERMRDEAVSRFHLRSVDIIHRIGSLSIGDNIVLIVCAAGHRKEASPPHYPSNCLQEREHEGKDEDRLGSKGSSETRPGTLWEISQRQRVHALYNRKLPGLS